jgi:hypothetical protein
MTLALWVRNLFGALVVGAVVGVAVDVRADAALGPAPARGLAVLAEGNTSVPASALAHSVYGDPGLLPPGLDEARARALIGEPVAADATQAVRDLADTRAAIHGDDAPSKSLLAGIATLLHVKGVVVVVESPGSGPVARVFVAGSGAFDAVLYQPDPGAPSTWGAAAATTTWSSAATALHRGFAEVAVVVPLENRGGTAGSAGGVSLEASGGPRSAALAPIAPAEGEKTKGGGKPFYTSPWFWGAIGAAAFAGAAFFFATRDSSDPNIALQVQVPK